MFVASIVFTLAYLAYYPGLGNVAGAGGWTSAQQLQADAARHEARFGTLYAEIAARPVAEIVQDPTAMQVGRRLFLNHCATCHGINAGGAHGFPSLIDADWIWGSDFAAIQHSIAKGRIAAMPGWGAALGNRGVTNVAHYVLSLSQLTHDASAAAQGADQYQVYCVACHKADGRGDASLGAPDLTNGIFMYGDRLVDIAESIASGRNGVMPAHDDLIGPDKTKLLAAYLLSIQPSEGGGGGASGGK